MELERVEPRPKTSQKAERSLVCYETLPDEVVLDAATGASNSRGEKSSQMEKRGFPQIPPGTVIRPQNSGYPRKPKAEEAPPPVKNPPKKREKRQYRKKAETPKKKTEPPKNAQPKRARKSKATLMAERQAAEETAAAIESITSPSSSLEPKKEDIAGPEKKQDELPAVYLHWAGQVPLSTGSTVNVMHFGSYPPEAGSLSTWLEDEGI